MSVSTTIEGYSEVTAYPAELSEKRFPQGLLWKAAAKGQIWYRGWPFIFVDGKRKLTYAIDDGIQTVWDPRPVSIDECYEVWRLKRSGLFFHRTQMMEEAYRRRIKQGTILIVEMTVYRISEAISSLWHLYKGLGVPETEPLTISFAYRGVKDRSLVVLNPTRMGLILASPQVCRVPQFTCERCLPLQNWRAYEVDLAIEISAEVFQQFQWLKPDLSVIRALATELLVE
jgi:hypothetical protein